MDGPAGAQAHWQKRRIGRRTHVCTDGLAGINNSVHQILDDPLTVHSAKPKRVRSLITQLVGELPRIELFSRNEDLDGWYNWGNKI